MPELAERFPEAEDILRPFSTPVGHMPRGPLFAGMDPSLEKVPAEVDFDSVKSILDHAFRVPEGWAKKPLAELIRRRVELGIDNDIHDATYWLSEFACPNSVDGEPTNSHQTELLLATAAFSSEDPSKLPTSDRKIDALFTNKATANSYRALLLGDVDDPQELVWKLMDGELGYGTSLDQELIAVLAECQTHGLVVGKHRQAQALQALNKMAEIRTRYQREAQTWVQTHGTTPREKLVAAWKVRRTALKEGVADNPTALIAWDEWDKGNRIKRAFSGMEQEGTLPAHITYEHLDEYPEFIKELSQAYDSNTAIIALAGFIEGYSPEAVFPTANMELSDGSRMEVMAKDDIRIFTVGGETRCCMTPTGRARSCVEAAYSNPNVSIMALYNPDGDLTAHSMLFTNQNQDASVIVVDNIETSRGRNMNRITALYQEFFTAYLQQEELAAFSTVHVGSNPEIGAYTGPPLKAEKMVSVTPGVYSDAKDQFLLYDKNPVFGIEFVPTTASSGLYLSDLEAAIYGSDANHVVSQRHEIDTQYIPQVHSYLVEAPDGETAGYMVAYETFVSDIVGPDENVPFEASRALYIDDLALLPEYQGKGYGEKAFNGMLKVVEQEEKPLFFHARDSTSWPIIEAKRADLEARGFEVEVLSHDPDYFDTGKGARLVRVVKKQEN